MKPLILASGAFTTMTILDEKEPTISLKLIVAMVSVATLVAFAGLFAMNHLQPASAPHAVTTPAEKVDTGNI